eukprot:6841032-Karenia_brevis.AAC.1
MFYQLITQRGPSSVAVSWVKGHASQSYIGDDQDIAEQSHHNNIVDAAAKNALSKLNDPNVVELSRAYAQRFELYSSFLHHIHLILCRVYVAYDKLRSSDAYKLLLPTPQTHVCCAAPPFPTVDFCSPLTFTATRPVFKFHFRKMRPCIQ